MTVSQSPIQIRAEEKHFVLRAPYELRDLCRSLPSARWDPFERVWLVPKSRMAEAAIRDAFRETSFNGTLASWTPPATKDDPIPACRTEPWRHQRIAYWFAQDVFNRKDNAAHDRGGAMLALDMGCG